MLDVSASEFDLITLTRAIVGLGDPAPTLLRTETKLSAPSPACVSILKETLAKGCIRRLAVGGWRNQNRVSSGERTTGRLWERYPAPAFEFTKASENLLRWLSKHSLVLDPPPLTGPPGSLGDELVFFLAMEAAASGSVEDSLARQPAFQGSALCWLGFADVLSAAPVKIEELPDFSVLADGVVIEGLEDDLGARWIDMEHRKGEIVKCERMVRVGEVQREVLTAFFAAIEAAGRRDLCRFAVIAGAALGEGEPDSELWIAALAGATKLSERMGAREAAMAFVAALEIPAAWVEAARGAHFIDDDYAAGQILLEIWEMLGPQKLSALRSVRKWMTSIEAVTGE